MNAEITVREGESFTGRRLKKLEEFLEYCNLEYDSGITYSIVLELEDEIVGTGSIQGNVMKCIAVHDSQRGQGLLADIVTRLYYYLTAHGITHYFLFTKPKNQKMFEDMAFYPIICTNDVLLMENQKSGIINYTKRIVQKTEDILVDWQSSKRIGAIVANCNPFTKGHRYLIEEAAKTCDVLHLFILSEESGIFTAKERYEMVELGIQGIDNIILHLTSDYLISSATFPTYFMKDKEDVGAINCRLDLEIFYTYIVQALHINVRFVGEEPCCKVTSQYNQIMKEFLQKRNIEVKELPRKSVNNNPISASYVRRMLMQEDYDTLIDYIPETTLEYLKNTKRKGGRRNGRVY